MCRVCLHPLLQGSEQEHAPDLMHAELFRCLLLCHFSDACAGTPDVSPDSFLCLQPVGSCCWHWLCPRTWHQAPPRAGSPVRATRGLTQWHGLKLSAGGGFCFPVSPACWHVKAFQWNNYCVMNGEFIRKGGAVWHFLAPFLP